MELTINFYEIWIFIKRHLFQLMLTVIIFGVALSAFTYVNNKPTYKATSSFYVEADIKGITSEYSVQIASSILNQLVATSSTIASSKEVLKDALKSVGVDDNAETFSKSVTVSTVSNSLIIKIVVSYSDNVKVAEIANAIANSAAKVTMEKYKSIAATATVLDKADTQPLASKRTSMIKSGILGAGAGFVIFICFSFLFVLLDPRIRDFQYATERLKLHRLGNIPKKATANSITEHFGALRSAIKHTIGDKGRILIASPTNKDGKTFVSQGLAISLAKSQNKVLLIDANLRGSSLSSLYNIKIVKSLADVFIEKCDIKDAIYKTDVDGLSILPSVSRSDFNPSDILSTAKVKEEIVALSAVYDYIIIDTPSVCEVSDATALVSASDAVILVAKHGYTTMNDLNEAYDTLESSGANIAGLVCNGYVAKKKKLKPIVLNR